MEIYIYIYTRMFHSSITFYVECNQIVVCNITDITTSAILIASNNDVIDTQIGALSDLK